VLARRSDGGPAAVCQKRKNWSRPVIRPSRSVALGHTNDGRGPSHPGELLLGLRVRQRARHTLQAVRDDADGERPGPGLWCLTGALGGLGPPSGARSWSAGSGRDFRGAASAEAEPVLPWACWQDHRRLQAVHLRRRRTLQSPHSGLMLGRMPVPAYAGVHDPRFGLSLTTPLQGVCLRVRGQTVISAAGRSR
jgi:hypothetical protein